MKCLSMDDDILQRCETPVLLENDREKLASKPDERLPVNRNSTFVERVVEKPVIAPVKQRGPALQMKLKAVPKVAVASSGSLITKVFEIPDPEISSTESVKISPLDHLLANGYEHDPFTPDLVKSAVEYLYKMEKAKIAVILCEATGKVVTMQAGGWQLSSIQRHKSCIESIARRLARNSDILVSVDSIHDTGVDAKPDVKAEFFKSEDPLQSPPVAEVPDKAFCMNLNEISDSLRTPLMAWKWELTNSGGFVLLVVDAAERRNVIEEALIPKVNRPLRDTYQWICRDLDAWLVLNRSKSYLAAIKKLNWVFNNSKNLGIGLVACLLTLVVPIPYRPSRDCVIEPEKRQYVSSPVAGRIAECFVRPGDRVTSGQLLAKLDGEDVLRELASAEADREGANRRFSSALAAKSSGDLGIAKVEILKAETLIESLTHRLDRLEVRSTGDGIVILGDWYKSIGAPVDIGQSLFEIASLESMIAEVHLDSQDLGHISIGDAVSVRSDASGLHSFRGEITRIEPRPKVDGANAFFIADVVIDDPDRQLRPGMDAEAKISAGWKTIGWLLFSRPIRWISNQWVW